MKNVQIVMKIDQKGPVTVCRVVYYLKNQWKLDLSNTEWPIKDRFVDRDSQPFTLDKCSECLSRLLALKKLKN